MSSISSSASSIINDITKCLNRITKNKNSAKGLHHHGNDGGSSGGSGGGNVVGNGNKSNLLTPKTPRKQKWGRNRFKNPSIGIKSTSELFTDREFLVNHFLKYFHGLDKLTLLLVCKQWKDICFSQPDFFNDLIPHLKCREFKNNKCILNANGERRRFYGSIVKRGYQSLKLSSASDEDGDDVSIHFSQGSSQIRHLILEQSSISDKGLFNLIDHLSNLREIELISCNEISEIGFKSLPSERTEKLRIEDCIHFSDQSMSYISNHMSYLGEFHLQAYHVTDVGLISFKYGQTLTTLSLNHCWEISNQALIYIVSSLPNIVNLNLSGCTKISDNGIEVLSENLPNLKTLDLSWNSRISDSSLEFIACDLCQLESLILDRCCQITDLGIGYISTLSNLQILSLRWLINLREITCLISLKKLKFLSLAGCNNIFEESISNFSRSTSLQELEITNCGFSPKLIESLSKTNNFIITE